MLDAATQALIAAKDAQIAALTAQLQVLTVTVQGLAEALRLQPPAITATTVTLGELYVAYEVARHREHSWKNTKNKLAPLIRRHADLPAMQLTPRRWRAHHTARQSENTIWERPPSRGTLTEELSKAKSFLAWAASEDQGLIPHNPLRDAKGEKPAPPKKSWLPESEIQRLVSAPQPSSAKARAVIRAFVLTKGDTGLRFEELRKLRRDRVRRSGSEGDRIADIPETKNRKSHVVGLTDRAFEALEALPHVLGSPYYFCNEDTGKLHGQTTLRMWFNEAVISSGVSMSAAEGERITPHTMRRSAATNAHARGASLLEVMDMLNHSDPGITAQYVRRNESNAIRIAKMMQAGADRERKGPQRTTPPDKSLNIPGKIAST